ncbi:MAG: hypothetical protein ACK4S2_07755 [Gemmobacter sp.]|uniref:hypothetical protein n=1 Tax=Gemmobacter sp. TaxID=1898957 RepID=UPI00391A6FA8
MTAARVRAGLVALAGAGFVASAFLTPPFRGYDPALMPVPVANPLVQPAGFAFAIWGPIYLWFVAHAGYGLWKRAEAEDWDATRGPLIASLVMGAGWLPLAHVAPVAATVLIWAMLGTALLALARAPQRDAWLARVPLGLYAGWLTAASAVSLGVVAEGWGLLPGPAAALAMLALASAVAALGLVRLRTGPAYAVAAGWGFFGIAVKAAGAAPTVAIAAACGMALLAVLVWVTRRL